MNFTSQKFKCRSVEYRKCISNVMKKQNSFQFAIDTLYLVHICMIIDIRHGGKYIEMYLNTDALEGFKHSYKYFSFSVYNNIDKSNENHILGHLVYRHNLCFAHKQSVQDYFVIPNYITVTTYPETSIQRGKGHNLVFYWRAMGILTYGHCQMQIHPLTLSKHVVYDATGGHLPLNVISSN